jgi:AcrR family transcriptional regulator
VGARTARAPAEQRRAEILRAAEACFSERGYHGTTIDEIAERCGLSKGAIYWHFPGKRELFLAIFDDYRRLLVEVRRRAREAPSASDGLRRFAQLALVDEATELVPLVELTLEYVAHASRDEDLRDRFRLMYQDLTAIVVDQVERGLKEGTFRAVAPEIAASLIVSFGDGLLMQKIAFPELDLARAVREGLEIVLTGLESG